MSFRNWPSLGTCQDWNQTTAQTVTGQTAGGRFFCSPSRRWPRKSVIPTWGTPKVECNWPASGEGQMYRNDVTSGTDIRAIPAKPGQEASSTTRLLVSFPFHPTSFKCRVLSRVLPASCSTLLTVVRITLSKWPGYYHWASQSDLNPLWNHRDSAFS